jgi:hypothetical protein
MAVAINTTATANFIPIIARVCVAAPGVSGPGLASLVRRDTCQPSVHYRANPEKTEVIGYTASSRPPRRAPCREFHNLRRGRLRCPLLLSVCEDQSDDWREGSRRLGLPREGKLVRRQRDGGGHHGGVGARVAPPLGPKNAQASQSAPQSYPTRAGLRWGKVITPASPFAWAECRTATRPRGGASLPRPRWSVPGNEGRRSCLWQRRQFPESLRSPSRWWSRRSDRNGK